MKQLILIISTFLSIRTISAQNFSGTIVNKRTNEKLQGAVVSIKTNDKKINRSVISDSTGRFIFNDIPLGSFELKVSLLEFKPYKAVISSNATNVTIQLEQDFAELLEVRVFSKLNGEKEVSSRIQEKNANNIINIISAQAIQKSPDINAANILQRVSGVTIQRNSGATDAYSIIRGLEPRYNNTLINNIKIPSSDDKSRFVSLDIIPSDLLQKIEVSKSLLPEMEGDAIGGTVNLVMKDAPDTMSFKMFGSVGYSTLFFKNKYSSFSKKNIQSKSLYERYGANYVAQPGDFSRSNLDFKNTTALPTVYAGFSYGKRFFNNKLGLLIAENFQNQYYGTVSVFNQVTPDVNLGIPTYSDYSNRYFSTQQLNNGITTHLDYNINDKNKLILNSVFIYNYLAQARNQIDTAIAGGNGGRTVPGTGPVTNNIVSTTERQLLENIKLEGKHILSKQFLFDWAAVYSIAIKKSPDLAELGINTKIDTVHTTGSNNGPYTFKQTPYYFDNIARIWQHNTDNDIDILGNLNYKKSFKWADLDLKIGGLYRNKTRANIQNEYDLRPTTNSNGVKQVYTGINSTQWTVYDTHGTQAYDINNYHLFEDISAGYIQFKIITHNLDVFGGVRIEKTHQGYQLNTFYSTGINGITKNYTDMLPSIALKYKLNTKTNIRLSYNKSIARPNFYELVPASSYSSSSANISQGNPYLKHTIAENFDLRYELFPRNDEQLFVGVFYKSLKDPIEYAYINGLTYQPVNYGNAEVYGSELVFTKYFGNFGITGNYTYIYSRISSIKSFTDVVARITFDSLQSRPLQGQTDNTLNLSVLYKNEKDRLFVQAAYQYLGKKLGLVYPVYGFDYYQQPQSFLSLSAEKVLSNKRYTLFGKLNNILNTATVNKINSLLTTSDTYKANFLIGIRYSN